MSNNKKLKVLKILAILLVVVATVLVFFGGPENIAPQTVDQNNPVQYLPSKVSKNSNEKRTIATAWQWDNLPLKGQEIDSANNQQNTHFDVDYIYNALKVVNLDENGDVVTDHQALQALNETLAYSRLQLDQEALTELQGLIKLGLPGKAGEQTAEIVGNYYQYLDAERELNTIYNADGPSTNPGAMYEEILALRELYLGSEVSDGLFAISNADARYMFESFRIKSDSSLTDEEKRVHQLQNVKRHGEEIIIVPNWNARYADFLTTKKQLQDTGLANDDKLSQLRELVQQRFTQEELEKVRHLHLETF